VKATSGGNGNGVWKWVATTGAVFTVAIFTMGAGWFYDTRGQVSRSEFQVVQERQQIVLQRLAVVESQLNTILDELRRHEQNDTERNP